MVSSIELSITPESVKGLTDEQLDIVVAEKQRRIIANLKDSKESTEKLPEIEKENYKIDFGLSAEQMNSLEMGECITFSDGSIVFKGKDVNGVVYLQKDFTPEEKDEKKKVYIMEMVSGVDDMYKGEQMFSRLAVEKLGLENKIVEDDDTFKKICDAWIEEHKSNNKGFVQEYFSKNGKIILPGFLVSLS